MLDGVWWKLPLDEETLRTLFREYVEMKRIERGEDVFDVFILEGITS